ncbi:Xylose operon regulatory protein [Pseudobythopirellula maris]|uniref:Xylose operon regulatory protein n=1 Tax=Pseudobythopirellula maris TaxID=2527991 RepID=A0A5C5ZLU2_9BACT|nr:DNA-binding transcriptional regulator [Pseudobythopirellula maris]TWT88178.1 Xylose operon regulatory protein [Pseudobythopirellula maris]
MKKTPQVGLLIETARGYGREVSLGIARYARLHGPWSFHLTPGDFEQSLPAMQHWNGDGLFARLATPELTEQVLSANLPTIALDMSEEQLLEDSLVSRFAELRVDSEKAAWLAAAHLLKRCYPEYGFVGAPGQVWSERRREAFCQAIRKAGHTAHVYEFQDITGDGGWEHEQPHLLEWIVNAPKPIGIMACNDEHGLHVLDACREAGLNVPQDVAVVGVDNDELLCELSNPTLSSVALNAVEGGFQAAARLDKMMREGNCDNRCIMVDALRVVTRLSTDTFAVNDRSVAEALAYIKQSQGRDISADLVVERTQISRRELDARFRELLGHSVATEIQRERLKHAKRLLVETDYSIPEVAAAAGYSSASYMIQVFRRELDITPAKYRSSLRVLSATRR